MASNTQKGNGTPAAKSGAPSSANANAASPEDRKLLQFVRTNAQPIVAALTRAAAEEGDTRNWTEMNEYLQLATQFSGLCGILAAAGRPAATMAANA
jgi:hypothetical protein